MAATAFPYALADPLAAFGTGGLASGASILDPAALGAIVPEWCALAGRSVEANPFFEPDFLMPALRHLAPRGRVRVVAIRSSSGHLIALAPFVDGRIGRIAPARSLWTHDYGPLGVPLLDRDVPQAAAAGLLAALSPTGGAVALPFTTLDGPAARALRAAAQTLGRAATEVAVHRRAATDRPVGQSGDLRQALPTRRRKEFARQMRRLAELGEVSIATVTDPISVEHAFEEFLRLEQAGWKGQSGTALAASPAISAFARDVMGGGSGTLGRRISSIRLDGRPVAMVASFVPGSAAFTWKIAHDPEFDRFSPGAQLMLEVAAMLFAESGIRGIDSLAAPDHPMIDHLWADRLRIGTLVIGPARSSPLHRLGLAAMAGESTLRKRVRAFLRRLDR